VRCEAEKAALDHAKQVLAQARGRCESEYEFGSQGYAHCVGGLGPELKAQSDAQASYDACMATVLRQSVGYVTFLLVQEPGTGYGGGSTNWFDADVVFRLDSTDPEGKAFGFQLRDENVSIRDGMLAVLREAVTHNLQVIVEYHQHVTEPEQNLFVLKVAILVHLPARDPFDDVRVNG
jgi:hypothetical protein